MPYRGSLAGSYDESGFVQPRETVSWQFFFPTAVGGEPKAVHVFFAPHVRPIFYIPMALMIGYIAFSSPFHILSQVSLLFPGWSGMQAMKHQPPTMASPTEAPQKVLWKMPWMLNSSFFLAEWLNGWQETSQIEEPSEKEDAGYMFLPRTSAVSLAFTLELTLPEHYMFESSKGPWAGSLDIHKPIGASFKPALKQTVEPALDLPPSSRKFMKQVEAPKNLDVKHFMQQAQNLSDQNDLFGAIIAARQAYTLAPDSLPIIGLLGDLYLQSNQGSLFLTFIDDLDIVLRESDTVKMLEARFALINKNPEEALRRLKTIRTDSLGASQLSVLAAAYQMADNHELAVQTYWKLLHLKPKDGRAWVGLSISLEALDDKPNALISYEKALTYPLDPKVRQYVSSHLKNLKGSR